MRKTLSFYFERKTEVYPGSGFLSMRTSCRIWCVSFLPWPLIRAGFPPRTCRHQRHWLQSHITWKNFKLWTFSLVWSRIYLPVEKLTATGFSIPASRRVGWEADSVEDRQNVPRPDPEGAGQAAADGGGGGNIRAVSNHDRGIRGGTESLQGGEPAAAGTAERGSEPPDPATENRSVPSVPAPLSSDLHLDAPAASYGNGFTINTVCSSHAGDSALYIRISK